MSQTQFYHLYLLVENLCFDEDVFETKWQQFWTIGKVIQLEIVDEKAAGWLVVSKREMLT